MIFSGTELKTEKIQGAIRNYDLLTAHIAFLVVGEKQLEKIKQSKKLFEAFLKLINEFTQALKKIITEVQTPAFIKVDTFISPAKLFTQTVTHYTHTLSRP